ncbi:MAG: hypothetical protein AVDCRST_MAG96-3885 [uncultured Segetibacter sp.]|uniref:Uncharacterized protein n=1 Tax=uncultured Segetibacter sp. TaxID=481133 RepID=A0A6J4TZ44_9BACT|nr:MAG: hypothetical protein AVDCRST_MAG96-3885 [uncultured Segetibacter sp.]
MIMLPTYPVPEKIKAAVRCRSAKSQWQSLNLPSKQKASRNLIAKGFLFYI